VPYPAFRHRNFTLLWAGLIVSNAGTWMQNVAQSWLIYKMTGNDPLYLGLLGVAFGGAMTVVPPFGGVVVDRVDRVRLLYFTQTSALLLAAVLAVLTWTGALRPAHILVATLLGALLLAFDNPARQSLIADLVPREVLQNALSLNAATFTGAALLGPAIAGALLDVIGAGWLFMINAVSFLAVLFALLAMRAVPKHAHAIPPLREALLGGFAFAFARRQRWLVSLLVLSAAAAIFARSYQQLLPVFADGVFHAGAGAYGALLSAGGAGALVGALGTASVKDIRAKGRVMIAAGLALSALLAAFAYSGTLALAIPLVVATGVAATVFTTMVATLIQLRVPGPLRGRVIALNTSTLIGLPSLGSLGMAALAKTAGAPRAVAAGAAVLALALLLSVGRWWPAEAEAPDT
jgi:MFS family permease